MSFSDWFKIPFTKLDIPYATIFTVTAFFSLFIGIPLWLVTFGGFRYFHIMQKYVSYLVDKDLAQDRRKLTRE